MKILDLEFNIIFFFFLQVKKDQRRGCRQQRRTHDGWHGRRQHLLAELVDLCDVRQYYLSGCCYAKVSDYNVYVIHQFFFFNCYFYKSGFVRTHSF